MKPCITQNKYKAVALLLVMGGWWGLSKCYSPLVVPPIPAVAEKIMEILLDAASWSEIFATLLRMTAGLAIGVAGGCLSGLLGGIWRSVQEIWKPVLGIIQVVPPISWLILAIIWFGFNGKASIFIVALAVLPTISICLMDGIAGIDRKLVEMGKVFLFSPVKMLLYIYLPSVFPHFLSGFKIALGTACKTVIMGEVLTTTTGIGGRIMTARLNIEPETVIAWTVITVAMYYGVSLLGKGLSRLEKRIYVKYQRAEEGV